MKKKILNFAVEDIQLVEENINKREFSLLRVDAFSTGESLHKTFVTEETLKRTAKSILQKPFVFSIDKRMNDLYTHVPDGGIAGGFVPHNSRLEFKTLEDGRIMLSVDVLIWKRYSSGLIEYFERDGGKKGVSVEIEIFESKEDESTGLTEIIDFCYNAITGLGDMITSAIPNAQAVMSFSKDFEEAKTSYQNFDKYSEIDFTIPKEVKDFVKERYDLLGDEKLVSQVSKSGAKNILRANTLSANQAKTIMKYLTKYNESEADSKENLSWLLLGGNKSMEWLSPIVEKITEIDETEFIRYSEDIAIDKNMGDNYLALENMKERDNKNMKKIQFSLNSTQIIEILNTILSDNRYGDDHWCKYWVEAYDETYAYVRDNEENKTYRIPFTFDGESTFSLNMDEKEIVIHGGYEVMAKEDDDKKEVKPFSYAEIFGLDEFAKMFAEEEDDDEDTKEKFAQAKEEFASGMNPSAMFAGLVAYARKMASKFAKAEADKNVYMAENEKMKEGFAQIENEKKEFAVNTFLKSFAEKFEVKEEDLQKLRDDSKDFALADINTWQNNCKAFSYDLKVKKNESAEGAEEDITRYALVDNKKAVAPDNDFWGSILNENKS